MNPLKLSSWLFKHYSNYYGYERLNYLRYAGMVGLVGYPLFYLIYVFVIHHPYENLPIRLVATVLCFLLMQRERWPASVKRYGLAFSWWAIMFCLPFFHVFMTLKNQGGIVLIVDSMMAVFFMVLLTDWRNTVAMLLTGAGLGTLAYILTTEHPVMPVEYIERLPTVILVIVGGSLFKFSEEKMAQRLRVTTALAGSIAHEMRNPLGQIKYSLDCIEQSLPVGGAAKREHMISAESLGELYRQLTEGRRTIERGLQVISMTLDEVSARDIDVGTLAYLQAGHVVRKAIGEYSYETESIQRKVSIHIEKDFVFRGDETIFMFILFNLLKNSLYYCDQCPAMTVSIVVDGPKIMVTDTGPGIAEELMPTLFEPFTTSGKSGGTGLGLAYCKRAVQAFGGSIGCQSARGEFTSFSLQFPEVAQAEFEAHAWGLEQAARRGLFGKRILLVDDDALSRQKVSSMLEGQDFQISEAANGLAAMEHLSRNPCDLVLMDINMPVLDGYTTAQRIRSGAIPGSQFVPILAHSSEPAETLRVMSARSGMNGFIGKPYGRSELIAAMSQCITQGEQQAHYRELTSSLSGMTVLVADDNAFNRMIVNGYLQQWGIHVLIAAHGAEVLQQLEQTVEVDAVLMDLNMPGLNGFDTAGAIRNLSSPHRNLPIIALTGDSGKEATEAASAAGMNELLTKPVDALALSEALRRHVSGSFNKPNARIDPSLHHIPRPLPGQEKPLLDVDRLEEFRRIDMLDSLPFYLEKVVQYQGNLKAATDVADFKRMHEAMHSLLGMSGDVGALALHAKVLHYYPDIMAGRLPPDADWLEQLEGLHLRTAHALNEGYISPHEP